MKNIKKKNYYQNIRTEVMSFIDFTPKNVLEIGCGQGLFGKSLKDKFGCNVTGVEINKKEASEAKEKLDKVYSVSIEEAIKNIKNNEYDLIVANDVLEHLIDPYTIIRKLNKKLSSKGVMISSIPNMRNFHVIYALIRSRQWRYVESGILDFTHLRFFTDKSIIEMFEDNNFIVIKQEGINKDTSLPYWFRFLNIISGKRFSDMFFLQFVTIAKKKRNEV